MSDIAFLSREPSFSFLYFTGDVYEFIPGFLASCGYLVVAQGHCEAGFCDIYDAIGRMEGPRNSIVRKAAYRVPGGTVLLDPEMAVAGAHAKQIVRFCAEHHIEAFVAIWERYSQTIIGRHIGANGAVQGTLINPPPSLMNHTDPAPLKAFLAAASVPLDQIFATLSAWIFKLDQSPMGSRPD